jgi:hypothetical protein
MSHSPTQTAPQRGTLRWQTQRRLPKPLFLVLRWVNHVRGDRAGNSGTVQRVRSARDFPEVGIPEAR